MSLVVTNRTPDGFFEAAKAQKSVKDTPANRKLCADVIMWCQENEDHLITLQQSYGAHALDKEPFLKHAVREYKEQKYGSILMMIAFQLIWMLVKLWIDSYFFRRVRNHA